MGGQEALAASVHVGYFNSATCFYFCSKRTPFARREEKLAKLKVHGEIAFPRFFFFFPMILL